MKLKALDQVHLSSVKPDSLRPGEEFEVSDDHGAQLLKALPGKFVQLDSHRNKARPAAPRNKGGKSK